MAETSFHFGARDGDVRVLSKASKKDVNKTDGSGMTPLHWASWHGSLDALKLLVHKG